MRVPHTSRQKPRVLLCSNLGKTVGGIAAQTTALVAECRRQGLVGFALLDTSPCFRGLENPPAIQRAADAAVVGIAILWRLVIHLVKFRPTCLHVQSAAGWGLLRDWLFLFIARLSQTRTCITFHFGRIPELMQRVDWESKWFRRTCHLADTVVVLNQPSKEALQAALPDCTVRELPNGIDLHWLDQIVANAPGRPLDAPLRVVFIGHVIPTKGVTELVEACASMGSPCFQLDLIGPVSKEMQAQLLAVARQREDGNWLSLTGSVSREQAIQHLALADLFVLPSYSEGFPMAVLEAMACGKAVVATSVGAIPEMLAQQDHRAYGLLVPARDSTALRTALVSLLSDSIRRAKMGRNARQRAEDRYASSRLAGEYASLWRGESLGHSGSRQPAVCLTAPSEKVPTRATRVGDMAALTAGADDPSTGAR